MPTTLWSTNGSATVFKYKNPDAPAGASSVKIARVKPGSLKLVVKDLPFPVPTGAATIDVVFHLDGGTNNYCMTFTGTGDGSKFLVKDAAAGTCPSPGSCGNEIQEGTEQCDGFSGAYFACPLGFWLDG
jgi:hypothetical protein